MAEAASPDARLLAEAFVGHCVQNAGRPDKVAAAADVFQYEELTGQQLLMFAPQDPNAVFGGWLVKTADTPIYFLGTSEALQDGEQIAVCTVSNPDIPMDEVIEQIGDLAGLGSLQFEDEQAGQRIRIWDAPYINEKAFIAAMDAPKMQILGGTLSLSTPKEQ